MSEGEDTAWLEAVGRSLVSPTSGEESLRRRLLEVLLTPAEARKITYEELLAKWVDGQVMLDAYGRRRA